MSDIAIRVENLSKQYQIGKRERYSSLRDSLADIANAPVRRLRSGLSPNGHRPDEEDNAFWALKDVSFEIKQGEVVGIIGRNGAGKSTLLKILSRITEPTSGRADIYGRIAALLEVGTGFHPELTGRENIYLNGAILGMRRREIERKFDEIVDFAGVETFLDTPLKHYSTGMQMRTAFSVAAHLDPQILLVDEVLAVGDLEFQKKCLAKMEDVSKGGRTILLVTHQINQLRRLCQSVIWLEAGQILRIGPASESLTAYERASLTIQATATDLARHTGILGWQLTDGGHALTTSLTPFSICFSISVTDPVVNGHFGFAIRDAAGTVIVGWGFDNLVLSPGPQTLMVSLPCFPVRPGSYNFYCTLFSQGNLLDAWNALPELLVTVAPLTHPMDQWAGILNIPATLEHISYDA